MPRSACLLALAAALGVVARAQSAPDYCPTANDLYINAGGNFLNGTNFRCDVGDFVNVATWTWEPKVKPSIPGVCTEQYWTHRSTNKDMSYAIPVPAGTYTVYLGFMETFWNDTTRKFTVTVNGAPVTPPGTTSTTISIFDLAGGKNKPYVLPVTASAVDGAIKVDFGFIPGSDNPFVSSIGIVGAGATDVIGGLYLTECSAPTVADAVSPAPSAVPSASVAPSPSAPAPVTSSSDLVVTAADPDYCPAISDVFINAGGVNLPTNYRCDEEYFSAGTSAYTPETPLNIQGECAAQYASHRWKAGGFSYSIPVPPGVYSVILQWAETWAGAQAAMRMFTVTVNGKSISPPGATGNQFDILTLAGGINVPYAINVTTLDDNGFINVNFGSVAFRNHPFLSALGIIGADADGVVGVAYLGTCIPASQALAPSASFTPGASPSASLPPGASPSPTVTPAPMTTTEAVISDVIDKCPEVDDVFINVGGKNLANGYRCDNANDTYVTSGDSWVFTPSNPVMPAGNCTEQYVSHRVPATGVGSLEYTIPVPAGSYTVYVQMMETYHQVAGARLFNISVNGEYASVDGSTTIDLFALKGLNEPLMFIVSNIEAVNGEIKVAGFSIVDNVLMSGIGIKGNGVNASGIVGDTRLNDCGAGPSIVEPGLGPVDPVPAPDVPPPASGMLDDLYVCPTIDDVFINAGGDFLVDDIRCDNGNYFTGQTFTYVADTNVTLPGQCSDHYKTHRYANVGDMTFTLPVAPGTYTLYLMFMESFFTAPGLRTFSISVQGAPLVHPNIVNGTLDIYDQAGGMDKPLLLNITGVEAPTGSISVVFGKTVENPMVSGVAVVGQGANKVLGTGFINTCQAPPTKIDCSAVKFSDSADPGHVAHSVSGGPYVETDFDKDEKAVVQLDGLGSHSHESFPENGVIVDYQWTWFDDTNPAADPEGKVTATTGRPAPTFPLGTTQLNLTVTDQFCNAATETTTVTVNPATKEGAYCYYYDLLESMPVTVPLPVSLADGQKPKFAQEVGDINFGSTASFGTFPFADTSFAVRCVFSLDIETATTSTYQVVHNGPVKVYFGAGLVASSDATVAGTVTETSALSLKSGLNSFQVLYVRKDSTAGELKFQDTAGEVVSQNIVRYDASTVVPVITALSDTTALASEILTISGSAFVNGVQVKFGDVLAEPITSSATSIQVRVPPKQGAEQVVDVVIETLAGISNGITFSYGVVSNPCQLINFAKTSLKSSPTQDLQVNNIAVIKYGPDGRLYGGATNSKLYAWTLNKDLVATKSCFKTVIANPQTQAARNVLGIAFNPKSLLLKMYFTTSTFYWTQTNKPGLPLSFADGWKNGKVQSITVKPNDCFNDDITDVVSGLPVTDHDHGVNFLQFLPDGRLLIAIGGFTNGGLSVPGDGLGGIPAPPYAGAIITCPIKDPGVSVFYSKPNAPGENTVAEDTSGCSIYAAGLRNTFAAELHTNGELYATDNGPNQGFGEFIDSCGPNPVIIPSKNIPDRLLAVKEGKCHGHPHLGRGKTDNNQCKFDFFGFKTICEKGLILNLQSSTNGVLEYRSNFFAGQLKGDLMLSKYSLGPGKKGSIRRVELKEDGTVLKDTPLFEDDSGLAIAEGPRGEVIMSRVFKNTFLVYKPVCADNFAAIYLISVLPRRGPAAGGHEVIVTGFNFGTAPIVKFGTELATVVSVSADGQTITCTTPAGTAGTQVKVTVEGSTGENLATTGSDYWYW